MNNQEDVADEINAKIIDDNDDDEEDEIDGKSLDDSVRKACNMGISFTQETILKWPEFFDGREASNAGLNNNDYVRTESVKKKCNSESVKTQCNVKQANVMDEENPEEQKLLESDTDFALEAIPLRSVLPDEIIDLDIVETV